MKTEEGWACGAGRQGPPSMVPSSCSVPGAQPSPGLLLLSPKVQEVGLSPCKNPQHLEHLLRMAAGSPWHFAT